MHLCCLSISQSKQLYWGYTQWLNNEESSITRRVIIIAMEDVYMKRKTCTKSYRKRNAKAAVIALLAMIICIIPATTVFAVDEDEEEGEYKVVYYFDDSQGKIVYYLRYQENSEKSDLDLTNLDLHADYIDYSISYNLNFRTKEVMSSDVRIALLYRGFATIIDPNVASAEELEAEENAKINKEGFWSKEPEIPVESLASENGSQSNENEQWLKQIFENFINFLIKFWHWVAASLLSFSAVVAGIRYLITSRRVFMFFGGEKGAGKTTLKTIIMEPDRSEEELKGTHPTRSDSSVRYIRDDAQKKIKIVSKMVDYPGDDKYHVLNYLTSIRNKLFRKRIIVIVVAPTMANSKQTNMFDSGYINQQLSAIKILWVAVIKAKLTKVNEVILFINKSDICNSEVLREKFSEHCSVLKKACEETGIIFKSVIGSSVKRTGVSDIINECKKR